MDINMDWLPKQSSHYAKLVNGNKFALIPAFTLESGHVLKSVPVAYKTWGKLNEERDNVLVLCHALTGSSDAEDWWRPLMGPGKPFDYNRFFIFCGNILGSPYGSASPLTINPKTESQYGPDFPATTVRDDVCIHKMVLDALDVTAIAAVIGGSMGGMTTLEWALCTPAGYVRRICPITTSAYYGAWGIAWNEAQRQSIYADKDYQSGWYQPIPSGQPKKGLGAARITAMLTYRSHTSFEARFSRNPASQKRQPTMKQADPEISGLQTPPGSDDGLTVEQYHQVKERPQEATPVFSAQSYLQHQAEKFLKRFDGNCYLELMQKMDSHDVTRGRILGSMAGSSFANESLKHVLRNAPPRSLVIGVETDILFLPEQQRQLAKSLPEARFAALKSFDGHDGFLLEFAELGCLIGDYLREEFPGLYDDASAAADCQSEVEIEMVKDSMFGEAEADW